MLLREPPNGQAAAPPTTAMNSRRLIPRMGFLRGRRDARAGRVSPPPVLDQKDSSTTGWQTDCCTAEFR
jgi:hypothetical protein